MAIALGLEAIEQKKKVRFLQAAQLVLMLQKAREEKRLEKAYEDLLRSDVIIIDEFGYIPLDADGGRLLYQVMADTYETTSMIITTNIEFGKWGSVLADEKLAGALADRIVHHGRLIEFKGASRRVINSLMLGNAKDE